MNELYEKELADIAKRIREHVGMREAILKVISSCTCEERSCPVCRTLNLALPVEDMLSVRMAEDPVHYIPPGTDDTQPGWYFWDETWASRFGPYPDEPKAREMLNKYVEQLHGDAIEKPASLEGIHVYHAETHACLYCGATPASSWGKPCPGKPK